MNTNDNFSKDFREDNGKLIFMAQQIDQSSPNSNIAISDPIFNTLYKKFVNRFNFDSFYCGKVDEEKEYKRKICIDALKALHCDEWKESDIGTGKIINFVKQAVNIKDNNLVRWNIKKPDSDTANNSLNNKIFSKPDISKEFEKVIFQLYTNKTDDGIAFDRIRDLAGFYNYVAYLFFIKDPAKYLPISPENFDNVFKKFGLDFKTDMKCSWSNYQQYIDIIRQVQTKLLNKGIDSVTLLDVHTFCWMLKDIEKFDEKEFCSSLLTPSKVYSRKEWSTSFFIDVFATASSIVNTSPSRASVLMRFKDMIYFRYT